MGKMRRTGSVIEKDGSEWDTQRDSANREWYTNPKTGETRMAPDSAAIEAHNHAENQKSYAKIIKGQKDQEIVDYVKSDYARKAQTAVVENRDASPAELAKNVSERKEVERRSEGVGGKIDETPYNARWRNRPDSGYE